MDNAVVLVVGSANMDLVFRTGRMPTAGETLLGGRFSTHPGGKGANQAVAIGRLGGEAAFCGRIGKDEFGKALRESLVDAGVDARFLSEDALPTGTAGIFVDDEGRNMIVVAPGANGSIAPLEVEAALSETRPSVALCQLEIPLDAVVAASAAERLILNPAPARALPAELLARCYALTPNESELRELTGMETGDGPSCERAARSLLDRGARNVVVTLGGRGCLWVSPKASRRFPARTVHAIDTTAAGDAFNGALAMFLAQGRELDNAIPLANCVGALATTRPGAQQAMPTLSELRALAGPLY